MFFKYSLNHKMEIVSTIFNRENLFKNSKTVLPMATSDNVKCHDFDFNKANCLWQSKKFSEKKRMALIYPINPANKIPQTISITVHSSNDICDMV